LWDSFVLYRLNNPEAVGTFKNTLGWYYSEANNLPAARGTAKTSFPYSRVQYYDDGTSEVKRNAAPGDAFKMGAGHETRSKSFGITNELDEYVKWRKANVAGNSNIANMPDNILRNQATKTVSRDENGKEAVVFADKTGKMLASAIFEGEPSEVPNEVTCEHKLDLPFYWANVEVFCPVPLNSDARDHQIVLSGYAEFIQVYSVRDQQWVYRGKLNEWDKVEFIGADNENNYQIRSDKPFKLKMVRTTTYQYPDDNAGYSPPPPLYGTMISTYPVNSLQPPRLTHTDFHIPVGGSMLTIENTNPAVNTKVVDLVADTEFSNQNTVTDKAIKNSFYRATLPAYKDLITTTNNYPYQENYQPITLKYKYKLYNLSYTFYNDAGGLYATLSPNGVQQLRGGATFGSIDKSTAKYNSMGMVLEQTEKDGGTTKYIYAKDGRIRFSQSAKQAIQSKISFTDYDYWYRPVRSGECSAPYDWASMQRISTIEELLPNALGDMQGVYGITQMLRTGYDIPAADCPRHATQPQTWVAGQVSWTEKVNKSKTWYSYDDMGRVLWTVQKLNFELNNQIVYKSLDYEYDKQGNVVKVIYQKGTSEEFSHLFEYDKVDRLAKVYTKDYGRAAKLLAKYEYYYHGGLKRVETGDKLQGTDYVYTLQGWLKSINGLDLNQELSQFSPDIFGTVLQYFENDYAGVGNVTMAGLAAKAGQQALYNGQITVNSWGYGNAAGLSQNNTSEKRAYSYDYDHKYQLKNASYGTAGQGSAVVYGNKYFEGGLSYDLNGNIKTLRRKDENGADIATYNYSYHGNSNKLQAVTGRSSNYEYDLIGQLTEETRIDGKKIRLTYDVTGKVTEVHDENNVLKVKFGYDEKGQRMEKINYVSGIHTWYVTDAGGKVVRIYEKQAPQPPTGANLVGVLPYLT
jgi:YD repeat-containing protein